jgi:hypothetical protein
MIVLRQGKEKNQMNTTHHSKRQQNTITALKEMRTMRYNVSSLEHTARAAAISWLEGIPRSQAFTMV